MSERPPVSGIVLAGGRATRMGGIDKGLVMLAGKPLVAHVLDKLHDQASDIVINANRHIDTYAAFGHPVIADTDTSFSGPLAGMAAALPYCRQEWALVAACDCPLLPANLADTLWAGLKPGDVLAVAHDGEHLQPLFMLLRRSLAESLLESVERGEFKVESWCRQRAHAVVHFSEPGIFRNINTEAERLALEAEWPK